jgi:retron-type reverse transcriptase
MNNLSIAHINAKKGKSHYTAVQLTNKNIKSQLQLLHDQLTNYTFHTAEYRIKKIFEPKERNVYILPYYPDRIVHHAIMQVLQPIFDKMFIYDLYSAIPGKGIHAGHERLRKFLKDRDHTKYCLKFDISKFYPSIHHAILFKQIESKIKCKDTLWLLHDIVYSIGGHKNLPIGNYLSQYFSNLYLNEFDHWLKEDMQIKYYIRYCDDGVILHEDKEFLKYLLIDITKYLKDNLKLTLNPKTRIFNVNTQGIDFLGYRDFRSYSLLRKSAVRTFKMRIKEFETNTDKYQPEHIISSLMSTYGWAKHCNTHNLLTKYLYDNERIKEIMAESCNVLGISNPLLKIINKESQKHQMHVNEISTEMKIK